MALVWHREVAGNRYEVRTHGASVRLYSNGVFHSQWNGRDPLKGSLWELLLLPAYFLPRHQIRRVLVLGVGGGAVIRLLQRFVGPDSITGVDLDAVHLDVARRFFGVRGAELYCADAQAYVADELAGGAQPAYDLIIDDLFGHVGGEAVRAFPASPSWCESLLKLLSEQGLVVSNFGSRRELLDSGWRSRGICRQLTDSWTAELPDYENCIGIFSREPLSRARLTGQAPPALNPDNPSRKLDSRLRPLR